MKPLIIKPILPEPPKMSIDIAEQIADKAATRAAQEVSRENMENFNRFQEQNKVQEQISQDRDSIYEEPGGGYSIDTKTEKNLMRRLLDQTLQKALDPPPPSPIEDAVTQVMGKISVGIAEKMLGSIGGSGGQSVSKPSFLIDILNTAAAHGFGESLGSRIPETIQSLTNSIGQQKTQELASAATKALNQPTNQQNNSNPDSSNAEKQKDMILALDVNNPDNVRQYASAMGLSEKAAQGMLQVHQDDILSERKDMLNSANINADTNITNNDIAQALNILIKEMTGMKETINSLQNKIVKIEDSETSTQERSSTQPTGKSVTLFSTPIKVDVDSIKGDTDSFFKEPSKDIKVEKQEESVLEEVIDNEGKSTFKMSDEKSKEQLKDQSKERLKEQPKEQIKEQPREQFKEQPKKVTKTYIETEEDKKKESSSVELVESEKNENELLQAENEIKVEEIKIEEQKPEENIVKKRIIRKLIPIKKDVPSHTTEHYDINNNLIGGE